MLSRPPRCWENPLGKSIAKATNRKFVKFLWAVFVMKQKLEAIEELT